MPESALSAAGSVADRLRRAIGDRVVEVSIGPRTLPVTISIGVAVSGPDAQTPAQLLRNADEALYAAKHAGRNRVMIWEREGTSPFIPEGILP
jgi:two-component system cell cycle response regulator